MRACEYCGASLEGRHERTRWCDNNCRRRDRYSGECEVCGAVTYNGNSAVGPRRCIRHREHEWTDEAIVEAVQRFARQYGRPPYVHEWNRPHARLRGSEVAPGHWPSQPCVAYHFGSWANAIEAAGFPRPRRGPPPRVPERQAA